MIFHSATALTIGGRVQEDIAFFKGAGKKDAGTNQFPNGTNLKNADLIISNKSIIINKNIDLILKQSCEIIIPLLLRNNNNFIGQIGQSLDGKIALNNGSAIV